MAHGVPTLPQFRRDVTVAVVGATSWAAVAWKIARTEGEAHHALEAALALLAALLCLWPVALGLAPQAAYLRWREWLVPAHLAAQHLLGMHFTIPAQAQQGVATPAWARGMLPVFLATFCQPWLYMAFGACLQRTRLQTFLWTQPLLLVPMLAMGHTHCAAQLDTTPDAALQLQRIVAAMQRGAAWLPVGPAAPLAGACGGVNGGGGGGAAREPEPASACLAVHCWLVALLAFCLPAIVIHRLEGQERQAEEHARKSRRRRPGRTTGSGGGGGEQRERDLLLQGPQSPLRSAAELALAGYAAWLAVQLAMQVLAP